MRCESRHTWHRKNRFAHSRVAMVRTLMLVACAACAPKLKECSLCRAPVKKRIKIKNSS